MCTDSTPSMRRQRRLSSALASLSNNSPSMAHRQGLCRCHGSLVARGCPHPVGPEPVRLLASSNSRRKTPPSACRGCRLSMRACGPCLPAVGSDSRSYRPWRPRCGWAGPLRHSAPDQPFGALTIEANLVEDGIGPVDDGLIRMVVQHRQRLGGAGAAFELFPVEKFGHDLVLPFIDRLARPAH
jgi:hypothetical protein